MLLSTSSRDDDDDINAMCVTSAMRVLCLSVFLMESRASHCYGPEQLGVQWTPLLAKKITHELYSYTPTKYIYTRGITNPNLQQEPA